MNTSSVYHVFIFNVLHIVREREREQGRERAKEWEKLYVYDYHTVLQHVGYTWSNRYGKYTDGKRIDSSPVSTEQE